LRLVALAETRGRDRPLRRSPRPRRDFPFDSFACAVKRAAYFSADSGGLGGLGVTSVHDVLVASSRLARGDASLSLGVNMHLVFCSCVAPMADRDRGR
jgi:hypothetical protein